MTMTLAYGHDSDDIAACSRPTALALPSPTTGATSSVWSPASHTTFSPASATTNGVFAVEESEHAATFSSRPGEPGPAERVLASGAGQRPAGHARGRSATAGTRSSKAVAQLRDRVASGRRTAQPT